MRPPNQALTNFTVRGNNGGCRVERSIQSTYIVDYSYLAREEGVYSDRVWYGGVNLRTYIPMEPPHFCCFIVRSPKQTGTEETVAERERERDETQEDTE